MKHLYGTIEKAEEQDDGSVIVTGYASSTAVDSQGETITAAAMTEALPGYMKFANIREMHQPKAAGVALEAAVQEDGRTWIKANIVDSDAVKKVKTQVYKGFSIGGRVLKRDSTDSCVITGIELCEISLVDRPANPEAVFSMGKIAGSYTFVAKKTVEETVDKIKQPVEDIIEKTEDKVVLGRMVLSKMVLGEIGNIESRLDLLLTAHVELQKRIKAVEDLPKAAKASLTTVAKEADSLTPAPELKKDFQSLLKKSLQEPIKG